MPAVHWLTPNRSAAKLKCRIEFLPHAIKRLSCLLSLAHQSIFPVIFCRFPVIANCFPCYWTLGKSIKNRQNAHKYWAIGCTDGPKGAFFRFSLYFSLLWGKNDPETGSLITACTASFTLTNLGAGSPAARCGSRRWPRKTVHWTVLSRAANPFRPSHFS